MRWSGVPHWRQRGAALTGHHFRGLPRLALRGGSLLAHPAIPITLTLLDMHTIICILVAMPFTLYEPKRRATLNKRGLDFADAALVFAGPTFTFEDDRE